MSSLTQVYPLRLSESISGVYLSFARFSASDSNLLLSDCLSASWVYLSRTHYLSSECLSLQISSHLTSTPTLFLGPPTPNQRTEEPKVSWEVSALGQRFLWTQGESCAGEVWKECVREPSGEPSAAAPRCAASFCLPSCLGRSQSARAPGGPAASQGIPSSSLPCSYWPRAPPPPAAGSARGTSRLLLDR